MSAPLLAAAQRLSHRIADLNAAARSRDLITRIWASCALPFAKAKLRDLEERALETVRP